jgi:hypothetical protein
MMRLIPRTVQQQVYRRAGNQCEAHVDLDGRMHTSVRCCAKGTDCALRVDWYYNEEEHGPLTADCIVLLCDECYENSEGGQQAARLDYLMAKDD